MPSSKETSWPSDQTRVSYTADRFFTSWATREAHFVVYFGLKINIQFIMATKVKLPQGFKLATQNLFCVAFQQTF